ncbi:TPA: hypothetical protein U1C35_000613 [Streptococcus suis]|nr:hypothetical protein [Streptococcus suis]
MMFFPELRSTLNRKETKIFLSLCLTPVLYLISTLLNSRMFSFAGPENIKIAFFDFYYGQFNLQFNSIIPSIALAFVSISMMRQEVQSKRLLLYKDINRFKILLMKLLSMFTVILIYSIGYFILSLGVYYLQVAHLPYGSLNFWSQDFNYSILSVISVISSYVIVGVVTSVCSLYFRNGITLIIALILNALMSIAIFFPSLAPFFPSGYVTIFEKSNITIGCLMLLGVGIVYCLFSYVAGAFRMKNLEF